MKKTVFLRSTIRQPVRSLFILLLVGVISFAFVSRVGEASLISREQKELIGYYKSIGLPMAIQESNVNATRDEMIEYLKTAPYVDYIDDQRFTSGVIQDGFHNANIGYSSNDWLPSDEINFDRILPWDVYFYGIYTGVEIETPGKKGLGYFPFTVDDVLAGYPELVTPDETVRLLVDWEAIGTRCTNLKNGRRYLLCASQDYTPVDHSYLQNPSDFGWLSLGSTTGWYIPAEENIDLTAPEYAALGEKIQQCDDNSRALHLIATADMSVLPAILSADQDGNRYYLVEGRWLDHNDDINANRAIVIHEGLADIRGLKVGDTITLKLRNITYYNGPYSSPDGYLYDLPKAGQRIKTQTETFEIVGIYNKQGGYSSGTSDYQITYIPLSVYPESFSATKTEYYLPSYNFALDSPEHEEAFLDATREDMESMGYVINFQETGYHNFRDATEGIITAARSNVAIFAVILAVCYCLACFVYFRFRRKDLAISRALGVPAGKCIASSVLPLILVGGIGVIAGSILAWNYTQSNAENLLSALVEAAGTEGATAALPMSTLALLILALIAALLVLALIFATVTVKKPVLSQLQGGGNKR